MIYTMVSIFSSQLFANFFKCVSVPRYLSLVGGDMFVDVRMVYVCLIRFLNKKKLSFETKQPLFTS